MKNILTEVYGYDFYNPPKKNYPYLDDGFIKNKFEDRSLNEWIKIKEKYNSNLIITPKNWKLNLNLIFSDKKYNLYRII